MRTITDYKEAANLCQTFTGHLVARANKTLNGIYKPYCLLNDDLSPLFCWTSQLCVQLYLGGYLLRNGGVLIASNPEPLSNKNVLSYNPDWEQKNIARGA